MIYRTHCKKFRQPTIKNTMLINGEYKKHNKNKNSNMAYPLQYSIASSNTKLLKKGI